MISYKKQKYNDIRTAISDKVLVELLQKTLESNKVQIDYATTKRVLLAFLSSISFYLYNYPEFYVDLKKMVLFRDSALENLFVLQAKESENAKTIMEHYKNGGAFSEELEELIKNFVTGVLEYSTLKEQELSESITKLKKEKCLKEQNSNNR